MKADVDRLMAARGLEALVVVCGKEYSPERDYLAGRVHITGGLLLKRRDAEPMLVVGPMEIEEAAKSGLPTYTYYDLGFADLLKAAQNDPEQAQMGLWRNSLEKIGVTAGKIGIYGVGALHEILAQTQALAAHLPQYEFVGERGKTLFDEAYITKDADEIARLQAVAERTNAVWQATWDFVSGHRADGDIVVAADGTPLTIGAVKRFVRRALLDHELEDTQMIFAQGRDAGFPHSRGEADAPLKLGEAIVFDLFPRELGGGYFHDSTRTWCLGYAPPEVQTAYDQVMEAFDRAVEMCRVGTAASALQIAVLDYFEALGHPTQRSEPGTMAGYVHSLGHGVGLHIHEQPGLRHTSTDTLQIGNVISIEPGLYYPEQGYGVRVEDLFYVADAGTLTPLTNFRKDLVLPLANTERYG
ncbi:MAG: M24 family metallopeptidase, partial [Chloroflexi bacterium]|nr:M24 family metallopeptidase [Chloroflexota bacterium]